MDKKLNPVLQRMAAETFVDEQLLSNIVATPTDIFEITIQNLIRTLLTETGATSLDITVRKQKAGVDPETNGFAREGWKFLIESRPDKDL